VAFNSINTTIGAITNSTELQLCASKAVLIKGSNGSLSLVLGSTANSAPACLVYPNGLSLDLTYALLSSGHVGCWSLYPPTQVVAIVNVTKPNKTKLQAALKTYRPSIPRIFMKPNSSIRVGTKIALSSSAISELIKTKLLNLPAQVRFIPVAYKWSLMLGAQQLLASNISKPAFLPTQEGVVVANLRVTFSVEYTFTGLLPWTKVTPNLVLNALPVNIVVGGGTPNPIKLPPLLVQEPCTLGSVQWRC
jgi:hypothetical protein